jgi:hypothetical protein
MRSLDAVDGQVVFIHGNHLFGCLDENHSGWTADRCRARMGIR